MTDDSAEAGRASGLVLMVFAVSSSESSSHPTSSSASVAPVYC